MEFVNHTPFPAMAFEGVDPPGRAFHVVVLRQSFTWNDAGDLVFAAGQQPLCMTDVHVGAPLVTPLLQESDLCPFKPRCDVIVRATAYPPRPEGVELRRFLVRLRVRACGELVIDKTLAVTGPRWFVRRSAVVRWMAVPMRLLSIGLLRIPPWKLTRSGAATSLEMSAAHAFGGECRVDDGQAVRRVPPMHRLTDGQRADRSSPGPVPLAVDALAANPAGLGFARDWFLRATRARRVAAPRIEFPNARLTASQFDRVRRGRVDGESLVAGFGPRPKCHPARVALAGTIDRAFIEGDRPLPEDFDFGVWNAAWPDQQVDALSGDESIELVNLAAAGATGVLQDARGQTLLRLRLAGQKVRALVRLQTGEMFLHPLCIDTVILDIDAGLATVVWRTVLAKDDDVAIRSLEVMALTTEAAAAQDADLDAARRRLAAADTTGRSELGGAAWPG